MTQDRPRRKPPNRSPVRASASAGSAAFAKGSYSLFRVAARLQESTWGYQFTRRYPGVRLEILNRLEVEPGQLLVELTMTGVGAERFAAEWRDYPGVRSVQSRTEVPGTYHYLVTSSTPTIHSITQRHRVLTRYPIVVQDGWSRFETFGSPSQIREFLDALRAQVGPSQVESSRRSSTTARSLGLTPAQDEIFRAALASGYYGAPRGVSLTTLAGRLGRSKSTVSVMLAKIQRRLADSALALDLATTPVAP